MGSVLITLLVLTASGLAVAVIWYYLRRYLPKHPLDDFRRWNSRWREVKRRAKETLKQRAAREQGERVLDEDLSDPPDHED